MLPPFIIEQIRRREEAEAERRRQDAERPRLEIPKDMPRPRRPPQPTEEADDGPRGVVILDLG
ncbi:MAG: hypothetical protein IT376_03400 [Polyangiaceae bacterium]|nr:hypothetical protein [Polyangiaceae bacterium]